MGWEDRLGRQLQSAAGAVWGAVGGLFGMGVGIWLHWTYEIFQRDFFVSLPGILGFIAFLYLRDFLWTSRRED